MHQLEGKVALVSGASRGIGRAIALDLAVHGADVVVNYATRLDAAETVCQAIRDMGRRALPLQADVAEATEVARMVEEATATFGRIDILVNNATLHRGRRVEKLPESDWDAVIDSCLKGAYHCCRNVVPQMRAQGGGPNYQYFIVGGAHRLAGRYRLRGSQGGANRFYSFARQGGCAGWDYSQCRDARLYSHRYDRRAHAEKHRAHALPHSPGSRWRTGGCGRSGDLLGDGRCVRDRRGLRGGRRYVPVGHGGGFDAEAIAENHGALY